MEKKSNIRVLHAKKEFNADCKMHEQMKENIDKEKTINTGNPFFPGGPVTPYSTDGGKKYNKMKIKSKHKSSEIVRRKIKFKSGANGIKWPARRDVRHS